PPTHRTDLHTPSLHDALPIWTLHVARRVRRAVADGHRQDGAQRLIERRAILAGLDNGSFLSEAPTRWTLNLRSPLVTQYGAATTDRKSTRLNSSHQIISYAVF